MNRVLALLAWAQTRQGSAQSPIHYARPAANGHAVANANGHATGHANAECYADRYPDLKAAFCRPSGCDHATLHHHYEKWGKAERREFACGAPPPECCTRGGAECSECIQRMKKERSAPPPPDPRADWKTLGQALLTGDMSTAKALFDHIKYLREGAAAPNATRSPLEKGSGSARECGAAPEPPKDAVARLPADAGPVAPKGGGLVVSMLFGSEGASYVAAGVANVLAFTLPSTKLVVHLSSSSPAKSDAWAGEARVFVNPERGATCGACGMVVRQHAANVRHAVRRGLAFDHVLLLASTCRLVVGGGVVEATVHDRDFSSYQNTGGAQRAKFPCQNEKAAQGWCGPWFDLADLFGEAPGAACDRETFMRTHQMAFAIHEGSFYPRRAAVGFADWLYGNTSWYDDANARSTKFARHSGMVGEELLWPTWTHARANELGVEIQERRGGGGGPPLCVHAGSLHRANDALVVHNVASWRLGLDRSRPECQGPLMFAVKSRAGPEAMPDAHRLLECLGRAEADGSSGAEDRQAMILACLAAAPQHFFHNQQITGLGSGRHSVFTNLETCAVVRRGDGKPFIDGNTYSDLAVAVSQWLASRRGREKPSPAAVLKALRENDVAGFAFGYGRNATAS